MFCFLVLIILPFKVLQAQDFQLQCHILGLNSNCDLSKEEESIEQRPDGWENWDHVKLKCY